MNKKLIRLPIFIVLILLVLTSVSYASVKNVNTDQEETVNNRMAIALVNEDEGANLNNTELDFGQAFVEGIDQANHEWFVVSRGVAENGLQNNTYDMMIVIPNDFSQRALSINTKTPEQVVLNYKINSQDNEKIQVKAEETANNILNDFNRRIIDVYFATILGNLHDAQDNVEELVQEYRGFTSTYTNYVNAPLANYTDQFASIKNSTKLANDSFSSFEDKLNSYEDGLVEQLSSYKDYQSSIEEVQTNQKSNNLLNNAFAEQLDQFQQELVAEDVKNQVKVLSNSNKYINTQFGRLDNMQTLNTNNISFHTKGLQKRLDEVLLSIEQEQNNFNIEEITNDVEQNISKVINAAFGQDKNEKTIFPQEANIINDLEGKIANLPSLDETNFENIGISPTVKQEILNVIKVTKQYNAEFGEIESNNDDVVLSEYISEIKERLTTDGVTYTDTVNLPESTESLREFKIYDIPEGFNIKHLLVTLPDGEEFAFDDYNENEIVKLSGTPTGEITVQLTLQLDENKLEEPLDIYGMQTWKWRLSQKNETQNSETKTDNNTAQDEDLNSNENTVQSDNAIDDGGNELSTNSPQDENVKSDSTNVQQTTTESDSQDKNASLEESNNTPTNEEYVVVTKTTDQYYVEHVVDSPLIDDKINQLIHNIEDTIVPYQQLLSAYETYFGISLTCQGSEDNECENSLNGKLAEQATEDSLYAFFNKNASELLTEYMVGRVSEELKTTLAEHDKEIDTFYQEINNTKAKVEELAQSVHQTREAAGRLDNNLQKTLEDLETWRSNSLKLLDSQDNIQHANKEEESMVLQLSDGFQPLLNQSQSLADQTSNNLDQAEVVYQTFETIDQQAKDIQESGSTLTHKAETLATNMTDNLMEDETFVENFTDVMANSRIGDRQNESLLEFMSNPVDAKKQGVASENNSFSSYYIVFISFLLALLTAYGVSTINQKHTQEADNAEKQSIIPENRWITIITVALGIVEGLVFGLVTNQFFEFSGSHLIGWIGLLTLTHTAIVLLATYLLRQLKMLGMFVLLMILSIYLLLSSSLNAGLARWNKYSPLQYVEKALNQFVNGENSYGWFAISMLILIILSVIGNLFIIRRHSNLTKEVDYNDA